MKVLRETQDEGCKEGPTTIIIMDSIQESADLADALEFAMGSKAINKRSRAYKLANKLSRELPVSWS